MSQQTCAEAHRFEHERARIPIPTPIARLTRTASLADVEQQRNRQHDKTVPEAALDILLAELIQKAMFKLLCSIRHKEGTYRR